MEYLFTPDIQGWASWGRVFQSENAWTPVIRHICEHEKLPFTKLEHLTPGTNAVFKVGDAVFKIFAPKDSGIDPECKAGYRLKKYRHTLKAFFSRDLTG